MAPVMIYRLGENKMENMHLLTASILFVLMRRDWKVETQKRPRVVQQSFVLFVICGIPFGLCFVRRVVIETRQDKQ